MLVPALVLASVLLVSGCATTGTPAPETSKHASARGLYTLELSRSFEAQKAPNDGYESFFAWRSRDWIVGVIVDGPPQPLSLLDEAVRKNAVSSDLPAEVVRVRKATLGGLEASRTEIVLEVEGHKLLMLNTHTSTANENVQLVVSGPLKDARALRDMAEQLEASHFQFASDTVALPELAPHDVNDPSLPVRFSAVPKRWVPARRGSVNEHAFLELHVPGDDLWFMAIQEVLEGEVAEEAVTDPEYLDRYATAVHEEMASALQPVPPGDLAPYDPAGSAADRRWSLGGHFIEGKVPITYRFRVMQRGPEILRLYCWGQPTVDVKSECDALYDLISLAGPAGQEL